LLGLLLWQLVWWLSRPTDRQAQTVSPWQFFYRLLSGFFRTFFSFMSRKAKITDNRDNPAHLYLALAAWGKNSGVPLQLMETPNEYGRRLCARFPVLQRDILTIITTQNRFVYGAMIEDRLNARSPQLLQAWGACRRLRSPRLWPMRMRSLLRS
jgi:hypothetical protein